MWWIIFPILAGAFVVYMYVMWIVKSHETFPNRVTPGGRYILEGRSYHVPSLPHMTYGANEKPELDRAVPMLSRTLLIDIRKLMVDSFDTLKESGVDFWVTGGTLIAAILWNQLSMCWDDDADCAVDFGDREYLWSPEFASLLDRRGLETFFLRGTSLNYATREGAAVRIRRKGTITPTLDLFFVHERPDGKYTKVNTWNHGQMTYAGKECWDDRSWVYPIRMVEVDGIMCPVGNEAEKMLDMQYGSEWKNYLKSPKPLTASHQWAFWVSSLVSAWRVGELSSETDPSKLTRAAFQRQKEI
jgi:hypothetical protein